MMAVFDLEGTLTCSLHREHLRKAGKYDDYNEKLCEDNINKNTMSRLLNLYGANNEVVILTAKPEEYRADVQAWLSSYHVPYDALIMRKPFDKRSSPEVKEDFVLANKQHILQAFDDRDDVLAMYKEYGITAVKVKNG